jgi:hypothetical protein
LIIGGVDTDLFATAPAELKAIVAKSSPIGRIGTISDIGDATALIASEGARWISGQAINVAVCFTHTHTLIISPSLSLSYNLCISSHVLVHAHK